MTDRGNVGEPVVHITVGNAVLFREESGKGGLWAVECLCGWRRDGAFSTGTEKMRATMEDIAEKTGVQHIETATREHEDAHKLNHPSNPAWSPPSNGHSEDCPVCGDAFLGYRLPQHLREKHPGGEA